MGGGISSRVYLEHQWLMLRIKEGIGEQLPTRYRTFFILDSHVVYLEPNLSPGQDGRTAPP